MYKVRFFCEHGASTKLLVNKCIAEAQNRGIELELDAYPHSSIEENITGADLVVLAPQVRFKLRRFQQDFPDYDFMVISPVDYGAMNAKNILDEMLKHLEK
jgi:PTS system cellobiose-specific IIB component